MIATIMMPYYRTHRGRCQCRYGD